MKAYVHIGMDKTGTTYLQQILTGGRARLCELGWQYPVRDPAGGEFSHVQFARALGFGWNDEADARSVGEAARHLQPLEAGKKLILSAEAFSTSGDPALVRRLKTFLDSRGYDEAEIVVFLRNQIDFFVGLYSESLKWGEKGDVAAFHRLARGRLFYVHLIDGWASVFGKEAIRVVNYDACAASLADAFFSRLGFDVVAQEELRAQPVDFLNRSPPQILMEGVRLCVSGLPRDRLYDALVQTLGRRRSADFAGLDRLKVWRLPESLLADVAALDAHNRRLAERYGFAPLADLSQAIERYEAERVDCDASSIQFLSMLMLAQPSSG